MNLTEAVKKSCEEPTLLDALSWICVWESERIVKQAKKNLHDADDKGWDTCFGVCLQSVMQKYVQPVLEVKFYVQDSRQYVGNSMLWWAKPSGYTCDIRKAQMFTKNEARLICSSRSTDVMWPKAYIDQRIQHHIDMQYCDLKEVQK